MAQQTAVDWLQNQIKISVFADREEGVTYLDSHILFEMLAKAKQMEKEQIIDAHIEGQRVFDKHPHTQWTNDQAEQYYNETYGKTK